MKKIIYFLFKKVGYKNEIFVIGGLLLDEVILIIFLVIILFKVYFLVVVIKGVGRNGILFLIGF